MTTELTAAELRADALLQGDCARKTFAGYSRADLMRVALSGFIRATDRKPNADRAGWLIYRRAFNWAAAPATVRNSVRRARWAWTIARWPEPRSDNPAWKAFRRAFVAKELS